jgi:hypothetical protein
VRGRIGAIGIAWAGERHPKDIPFVKLSFGSREIERAVFVLNAAKSQRTMIKSSGNFGCKGMKKGLAQSQFPRDTSASSIVPASFLGVARNW